MPVFPDAYLADTTHLTTEEHGAYLLLLMAMWRRSGAVPNDDRDLARMVGLELAKWRKVKRRLMPFLTVEGQLLTQKRLKKEWEYVQQKREKNATNGARGGRPKSNINNRLDKANGSENENPNESPHNPYPKPIEKADAFSGRASARKNQRSGWVSPRTVIDASESLIEEIEHHEHRRTEGRNEIAGDAVRLLPTVRSG